MSESNSLSFSKEPLVFGNSSFERKSKEHSTYAQSEILMDSYHRMTDQCFRKCVSSFVEPELGKGESACIDRCVKKYIETSLLLDERVRETEQANKKAALDIQNMKATVLGGMSSPSAAAPPIFFGQQPSTFDQQQQQQQQQQDHQQQQNNQPPQGRRGLGF
eukprot:TRINITY_DN1047_c0_g2_i1.p2 TRINITY_DN1047_c0_g2~~TRINITY_DN1047_c0_g2_i1.p2  ORF type:complete len:162 (+),score=43.22 TRINITY_DN1047_c0_g2_i1:53-538(+)